MAVETVGGVVMQPCGQMGGVFRCSGVMGGVIGGMAGWAAWSDE